MSDDCVELTGAALRDFMNAPPSAKCTVCARKTWGPEQVGKRCNMPQPDGPRCPGHMEALKPSDETL